MMLSRNIEQIGLGVLSLFFIAVSIAELGVVSHYFLVTTYVLTVISATLLALGSWKNDHDILTHAMMIAGLTTLMMIGWVIFASVSKGVTVHEMTWDVVTGVLLLVSLVMANDLRKHSAYEPLAAPLGGR